MAMNDGLAIGEVAARAGCATSAVRFYERVGLLPPPRRASGKRVYDRTVFEYLALIQLAQDAGFTIADTKALMHGFAQATPASRRWRVLAEKKLEEIHERIARAQEMQTVLHCLLRCECETLSQCVESRTAAMALAERIATDTKARVSPVAMRSADQRSSRVAPVRTRRPTR